MFPCIIDWYKWYDWYHPNYHHKGFLEWASPWSTHNRVPYLPSTASNQRWNKRWNKSNCCGNTSEWYTDNMIKNSGSTVLINQTSSSLLLVTQIMAVSTRICKKNCSLIDIYQSSVLRLNGRLLQCTIVANCPLAMCKRLKPGSVRGYVLINETSSSLLSSINQLREKSTNVGAECWGDYGHKMIQFWGQL